MGIPIISRDWKDKLYIEMISVCVIKHLYISNIKYDCNLCLMFKNLQNDFNNKGNQ